MAKDYEVLEDLYHQAVVSLVSQGLGKKKADKIAGELKLHFKKHWGGMQVYFPKGWAGDARDVEVYLKSNGKNHSQLAREYGISENWLYQVIKRGRALHIQKRKAKQL